MTHTLEPIYDKSLTCLYCQHNFTTKKVRSRFARPLKTDADFCQYYESDDHNPIVYFVNVCPECGFSFTDNTTSYFPPGAREVVQAQIASKWSKQSYSNKRTKAQAIQTYKLALYTATLIKEKPIVQAGICLRLGWLHRMINDREEEARFNRLALAQYLESYAEGDFEKLHMSEMSLLYLIGEINRRLGNYYEAVRFFSRVTNHPMKETDPKYMKLAREQWGVTKEMYEAEKKETMVIEDEYMIEM